MSTEDSVRGFSRAFFSKVQPNVIYFLESTRLYLNFLAEEIRNVLLNGYSSVKTAVHYITDLTSHLKITTSVEVYTTQYNGPAVTNFQP